MNERFPKPRVWMAGLGLLVAGVLAAGSWAVDGGDPASQATEQKAAAGTRYADTLSTAFRETAEQVLPAVVMIETRPQLVRSETPQGGPIRITPVSSRAPRSAICSSRIPSSAGSSAPAVEMPDLPESPWAVDAARPAWDRA